MRIQNAPRPQKALERANRHQLVNYDSCATPTPLRCMLQGRASKGPERATAVAGRQGGGGAGGGGGKGRGPPQQVFPQKLFCTSFPDRVTEATGRQHVLMGVEGAGLALYIFFQFFSTNFFPEGLQRPQAPRWCSRRGVLPSPKTQARRA